MKRGDIMPGETVFDRQTFTCHDYAHLCERIQNHVEEMENQGYNYLNFNLVNQVQCNDNWVKYQLIIAFRKRSDS